MSIAGGKGQKEILATSLSSEALAKSQLTAVFILFIPSPLRGEGKGGGGEFI